MESIQGKHFSITDPQGVNTVIYRVNKTAKEYLKEYPKYTVERLVSAEELKGELKKKTFFIAEPNYEEQLIILSFAKDKVVVNMGILEDNKVRISKKPVPVKFDTLYSEKEGVYKEFKYTPNLRQTNIYNRSRDNRRNKAYSIFGQEYKWIKRKVQNKTI